MSIDAPFDAYLDTPNKSVRQAVPRKGVCLHHAAMLSLPGLESLAMGDKQVSATAIVKDRISKRLMTDGYRAWSLSSAWGDSSFRTVETCNQSTDGWTISDESHWELALLVAYWALLDGFWPHRDGDPKTWTVLGHREMYTIWDVSYGTACPGGMDLNLVARRAQSILNGSAPAGFIDKFIGGFLMALSDAEQTELITKTRAIFDALFKTEPVRRPGRNATPGGVLVNQSIEQDAFFQVEGQNGATRDGIFESLRKIRANLGI